MVPPLFLDPRKPRDMASNARDFSKSWPQFYVEAIELKAESERAGRAIFEDREFVRILVPGDRLLNVVHQVTPEIIDRFPEAYARWKANQSESVIGTPLEQWPPVTKARAYELKAINIRTVEELAGIPDGVLANLGMGGRELRAKAQAWIAAASGNAQAGAMAAENEALKQRLAALEDAIARMVAAPPAPTEERNIDELSDKELRDYIKQQSGVSAPPNAKRDWLIERATQIANGMTEAA
jgi:hypothetical protein